jgi:hypothetical protein
MTLNKLGEDRQALQDVDVVVGSRHTKEGVPKNILTVQWTVGEVVGVEHAVVICPFSITILYHNLLLFIDIFHI